MGCLGNIWFRPANYLGTGEANLVNEGAPPNASERSVLSVSRLGVSYSPWTPLKMLQNDRAYLGSHSLPFHGGHAFPKANTRSSPYGRMTISLKMLGKH